VIAKSFDVYGFRWLLQLGIFRDLSSNLQLYLHMMDGRQHVLLATFLDML
jgi:hypothetical protein